MHISDPIPTSIVLLLSVWLESVVSGFAPAHCSTRTLLIDLMLTSRPFRFIKPAWLSHSGEQKDFEVYSCHVSPDGSRLATAAGDGHVRIWSTDAVLQAGDPNYTKPAQLCHMSYHSGTIHTVRFSPNGRWLASGADDKIICIYHLDTNPPSHAASFGMQDLLEFRI
jgi:WD40 repeat protein